MPGASTAALIHSNTASGRFEPSSCLLRSRNGLRAGMLAGRTLVLQRVTGQGTVFVHAAGDFAEFALVADEALRADTHALVWFDADCG